MISEPENMSGRSPGFFYFLNQNDNFYKWKMDENPFQYKIFIVVGTITLCIFGILDILFLQEPWRSEFLMMTFGGIGPFILINTLIYHYKKISWISPLFILLTLIAASLVSVKLVLLAENTDIGPIYPVLMIIVLFSFFLSGLHYFLSLFVSVVLLIAYYASNFEQFTAGNGLPKEVVFISLSILVSLMGGISLERSHKKRFQQSELLSYFADRDCLTGLFNRRYFINFADKIWKQCLRDQLSFTIMIADVDFFKKYNDSYGHIQGDNCLKVLSRTFESSMKRPFDLVSRYGGEEFIFLWFDTETDYIKKVMEEIRQEVLSLRIEHNASAINPFVTISAGVSSCIPHADLSINDLVQKADNALYRAKTEGRNRCIYH